MLLVTHQMSSHEISFNLSDPIKTRADFIYKITPALIPITDTGLGSLPITEDIEAVLRKIDHWHQGSISSFKIMCRDGKNASFSPLDETDEQTSRKKLLTTSP